MEPTRETGSENSGQAGPDPRDIVVFWILRDSACAECESELEKGRFLEFRWAAGQYDQLPGLAAELVRLKVDVIVTHSEQAIRAAKQATETVPIVMAAIVDPVALGFVASLARPGGNITGLSMMIPELVGKQLALIKEVVPKVSRVALLGNAANNTGNTMQLRHAQDAARTLGVRLQPLEVRGPSEIDSAFAAMSTERAGALIAA